MFDYSFTHWSTFFVAAILLNLTPGPDIAYVLTHTVKNGMRSGFAALFGVWSGLFLHVVFAALGLSVILATSATAYFFVKWIGALYLIWLGIQALRSNGQSIDSKTGTTRSSARRIYSQGVLVATLNPKVAFFFLAFLPQFVVPGAGPASAQFFLHGFLILAVGALIEPLIIVVGVKLSKHLHKNSSVIVWMERSLGTLFIGLGVRIALSEQS
ncbi:MAG: LysE family translocator [Gammaproteobacteria bacterium]|nr:LysE family translocator [Gammaproteobacteria bacterium]